MPHLKTNSCVSGLWIYFQGSGFLEDGNLSLETCKTTRRSCSWRIVSLGGEWVPSRAHELWRSRQHHHESVPEVWWCRFRSSVLQYLLVVFKLWVTSPGQTSQSIKDFIKSGRVTALVGWQFLNNTSRLPQFLLKLALSLFWEFLVNSGKVLWPKVL